MAVETSESVRGRGRRRAVALLAAAMMGAGLAVGGGGCTPGWYKQQADLQVEGLLRDRKRSTLSYEPVTEANNRPTPDAPGTQYEKVPVTAVPVIRTNVLEPVGGGMTPEMLGQPLGPVNVLPPGAPVPPVADYRSSVRDRPVVEPETLGPPSPTRTVYRLDLFGVLNFAVENNRDYVTQMESLYLAALDVTLQRHLFEPIPTVTQSVGYEGGQADARYRSALAATTNVGVSQRLPYGGTIAANQIVRFVDALNSQTSGAQSAQLALTGTIPLLRGAGFVNLEPLINSERQLVYTVRNFETFRRAFLVDTATRYLNLLVTRSQVINRRTQLDNFLDLVERSRALFSAGKGSFLDVQRSLNSQIQAETTLLQFETNYRAQLDNFKVFLGMDPRADLEIVPVEVDPAIPEQDPGQAVELAHTYRLDLATARDQIDDARRQVENAKNGLLPDLNVNSGVGFGTPPGQSTIGFNNDATTYNGGVTLGLPVDRLAERNQYRASLIFLQQAQRGYVTVRDQASVAARNALRQIRAARDAVELNFRNVQIAQRRLALANDLFLRPLLNPLPGLSQSNRDVVEAQTSLLTAQDSYDSARAQLQIQVLSYYRDTGTLRLDPKAGTLARAMARRSRVETLLP